LYTGLRRGDGIFTTVPAPVVLVQGDIERVCWASH